MIVEAAQRVVNGDEVRFLVRCAAVALLMLFLLPTLLLAQVDGRVVDENGKPIGDAEIWSDAGSTKTDVAGHFRLDRGQLIHVSKSGYRPITVLLSKVKNSTYELVRDPLALWTAHRCSEQQAREDIRQSENLMFGAHMRFATPTGTLIDHVSDNDFQESVVCLNSDCLVHGWGGNWSLGIHTDPKFFADLKEMSEREVYDVPNDSRWGAEYRGVRADGTYMRFVGVINETISYDHVSKQSADFFDRIIDSLCWFSEP